MKTILTVILLLMLVTACGGGGGSTVAPPTTGEPSLVAELAAISGDYTWEGRLWLSTSKWDYTPIGPYDGSIELVSATCVRVIVDMPDIGRRIDVQLDPRNETPISGFEWRISSDPAWPSTGYGYEFCRQECGIVIVRRRAEGGQVKIVECITLVGVRQ